MIEIANENYFLTWEQELVDSIWWSQKSSNLSYPSIDTLDGQKQSLQLVWKGKICILSYFNNTETIIVQKSCFFVSYSAIYECIEIVWIHYSFRVYLFPSILKAEQRNWEWFEYKSNLGGCLLVRGTASLRLNRYLKNFLKNNE